jgi:hypothetical protein
MKTRRLAVTMVLALAACAGTPPPDWQMNASSRLQRATEAYLAGDNRVAGVEFARARAELARTGRADLVARGELLRCAAQIASLALGERETCTAFQALAEDAAAPEKAYARYLAGAAQASDVVLLPRAQQALAANPAASATALAAIDDPLSRLVAAGVLFRSGRATPAVIAQAIDTAAEQGWRRPLLAWLMLQQQRARAAGAEEEVRRLQRRIDLVLEAAP